MSDYVLQKIVETLIHKRGWENPSFAQRIWTHEEWAANPVLEIGTGIAVLYGFHLFTGDDSVTVADFNTSFTFKTGNASAKYDSTNTEKILVSEDAFRSMFANKSDKITVFESQIEVVETGYIDQLGYRSRALAKFLLISPH